MSNLKTNRTRLRKKTKSVSRGKTRKNMPSRPAKIVVVGKIYADWCSHCIGMIPVWNKLEAHFKSMKNKRMNYKFQYEPVAIEQKNIAVEVPKLEQMYLSKSGDKIIVKVFPTIFRIFDGKIEYYEGERLYAPMLRWFTNPHMSPKTPSVYY